MQIFEMLVRHLHVTCYCHDTFIYLSHHVIPNRSDGTSTYTSIKTGSSRWSDTHRRDFADHAKHRIIVAHDLDADEREKAIASSCDRNKMNGGKLEEGECECDVMM